MTWWPQRQHPPEAAGRNMKKLATLLVLATLFPFIALAATPTPLDALPVAGTYFSGVTSVSYTYTVPDGGQNKLEIAYIVTSGGSAAPVATQNSVSMTCSAKFTASANEPAQLAARWECHLAAPTTGTFALSFTGSQFGWVESLTLQDAAQSSPIDGTPLICGGTSTSTVGCSVTTTVGNDILLSMPEGTTNTNSFSGFGVGETRTMSDNPSPVDLVAIAAGAWKPAGASAITERMFSTLTSSGTMDETIFAIKYQAPTAADVPQDSSSFFMLF